MDMNDVEQITSIPAPAPTPSSSTTQRHRPRHASSINLAGTIGTSTPDARARPDHRLRRRGNETIDMLGITGRSPSLGAAFISINQLDFSDRSRQWRRRQRLDQRLPALGRHRRA
jgi:hypothetical protein